MHYSQHPIESIDTKFIREIIIFQDIQSVKGRALYVFWEIQDQNTKNIHLISSLVNASMLQWVH